MPLIRLLMIALLAWILWRIWRLLVAAGKSRDAGPPAAEDMVRCARCAVHLPRSAALQHDADWFCSETHRAEHIAHRNDP
jgi:uncharacterized protein